MSVKVTEGRFRGLVKSQRRIVLPKKICEKIGVDEGTFFEGCIYSDNKILLTFIK